MTEQNSSPTPPPPPSAITPPQPTSTVAAPAVTPPAPAPTPVAGQRAVEGDKSFLATWLLSLLVGYLGIDRFYLGKVGTGILKLVTLGGIGVWWLVDLIMVLAGATRDRSGRALAGYGDHKKVAWIVTGAVILVGIILNIVSPKPDVAASIADPPAASAPAEENADATTADEPETAIVPNMVGTRISISRPIAEAYGLVFTAPADATDDSVIATQSIAAGEEVEEGTEVIVTVEPPKPKLTVEQTNAIAKAKDYLNFSGFSRAGLISQLEFEGYSTESATFGADNAEADWNAEAAEKAKQYTDMSAFSRDGLADQLAFEKFTPEQIDFALAAVGY
ncbi:Ltp family lipoprotein [Microbacterium sp. YJN-G]|uniref:Ltp family lipoprotein n=1 Tax=Microbacterium sp. YJN-G TaxID=2763257 RepID=UPI0018789256|nr:Ltp family lipoprotein [Microbacterium sp. YJN-G]